MVNKQFELEQSIMNCWNICEDLQLVAKYALESKDFDRDKIANIMIGMAELYQMKFENCFENFEETLKYFHGLINTYRPVDGEQNKLMANIENRHVEY